MSDIPWTKEFPGSITVCDSEGVLLEMNDQAAVAFQTQGGRALVGANLLGCHPEPARSKVQELLASPRVNAYTIEKNGRQKLIYQVPWYENGAYRGLVELGLPLPEPLPHFVRG